MRILIVDDEPVARRGLRREVQRVEGWACVGECGGRADAISAIARERPDVVLLDIQLGRDSGFDVIEAVGLEAMPLVIFVTAYNRHALRAFDVHAVDYVLKPVDPERLHEALQRASLLVSREDESTFARRVERLLALQAAVAPASVGASGRIAIPEKGRVSFVDVATIDWIEAFGNHVRLHVGARAHQLRSTVTEMERRLGGRNFIRIRRSALVNADAISTLESYGKGMFLVKLRGGASLVSSRYHQAGLRRLVRPDG